MSPGGQHHFAVQVPGWLTILTGHDDLWPELLTHGLTQVQDLLFLKHLLSLSLHLLLDVCLNALVFDQAGRVPSDLLQLCRLDHRIVVGDVGVLLVGRIDWFENTFGVPANELIGTSRQIDDAHRLDVGLCRGLCWLLLLRRDLLLLLAFGTDPAYRTGQCAGDELRVVLEVIANEFFRGTEGICHFPVDRTEGTALLCRLLLLLDRLLNRRKVGIRCHRWHRDLWLSLELLNRLLLLRLSLDRCNRRGLRSVRLRCDWHIPCV